MPIVNDKNKAWNTFIQMLIILSTTLIIYIASAFMDLLKDKEVKTQQIVYLTNKISDMQTEQIQITTKIDALHEQIYRLNYKKRYNNNEE